jgi:hypothetical protein
MIELEYMYKTQNSVAPQPQIGWPFGEDNVLYSY